MENSSSFVHPLIAEYFGQKIFAIGSKILQEIGLASPNQRRKIALRYSNSGEMAPLVTRGLDSDYRGSFAVTSSHQFMSYIVAKCLRFSCHALYIGCIMFI